MKTLILYGSKYKSAEKCAKLLAGKIGGEVDLVDIVKGAPELSGYDQVIIGSNIRFGQVHKAIKALCQGKQEELKTKRLGFFLTCGFPENFETHMTNNFPAELLAIAKSKVCFGGEMDITKLKGMDKFVAKMVTKASAKEGKVPPTLMLNFADTMATEMNA